MLELLLLSTSLFEVVKRKSRNTKHRSNYLRVTDKWMSLINSLDREIEILCPLFQPMVVPPLRWAPGAKGGYQYLSRYTDMIIHRPGQWQEAEDHDPRVYDAINLLQSTPWRVNRKVLAVMQQVWKAGGGYAGVPFTEPRPLPPRCPDGAPIPEIKARNRIADGEN